MEAENKLDMNSYEYKIEFHIFGLFVKVIPDLKSSPEAHIFYFTNKIPGTYIVCRQKLSVFMRMTTLSQ